MCEINGQKHEFNNETKNSEFTQSCFEWVESLVSALNSNYTSTYIYI